MLVTSETAQIIVSDGRAADLRGMLAENESSPHDFENYVSKRNPPSSLWHTTDASCFIISASPASQPFILHVGMSLQCVGSPWSFCVSPGPWRVVSRVLLPGSIPVMVCTVAVYTLNPFPSDRIKQTTRPVYGVP
jgi:hypothetical protein